MAKPKLRIAWFSPYESGPSSSTSAYVSKILLPLLSKRHEIEVFHDSFEPGASPAEISCQHYLKAFSRHACKPFDIFFYQMEDKRQLYFSRSHLALMPGIVWFHDFALSDDGPEPFLNSDWSEVVEKFENPQKEWPDRNAQYTRQRPWAMREAGMCFIPLFSSPRDHAEFKRLAPRHLGLGASRINPQSYYVPLPLLPWKEKVEHQENRALLRLCFCGSPRIEDRAHKILHALSTLTVAAKLLWLVSPAELSQAQALVQEYSLEGGVSIEATRSPERWGEVLQESDVALHLRYSAFGHSSPYLPLSMNSGRVCIVSDYFGSDHLSSLVCKISVGNGEVQELRVLLSELAKKGASDIAARTRQYALDFHSSAAVLAELELVFERARFALPQGMARWDSLGADARLKLVDEARACAEIKLGRSSKKETDTRWTDAHACWERLLGPCIKELEWGNS